MQPAIELKRKLAGGQLTLGFMIASHLWLDLIEIAIEAGYDYVVIDAEHMPHAGERIAEACQLGRIANFPVLLRPARTDVDSIRNAMDLGACGFLLPTIESAAQLDDVQRGAYMPPRGGRRPGGPGNRWVRQFSYDTFRAEVEDHLVVIPQIETTLGLANVAEIAAHPLVTALGVGPFDLSAELGICWKPQHPLMQNALQRVRDAADEADKPCWMIGDADTLIRDGYRFLCVAEASALLQSALTSLAQRSRAASRSRVQPVASNGRPEDASPYAAAIQVDSTQLP